MKWYWPLQASLEQLENQLPASTIADEHGVLLDEVEFDCHRTTLSGVTVAAVRSLGDVRDSIMLGDSNDTPAGRLRAGLSGEDVYVQTRSIAWCVFGGVGGQAVAYDLLLKSRRFRSGPHVDPVRDVGQWRAGVAILAYGMRFYFTYTAQTQEFQGRSRSTGISDHDPPERASGMAACISSARLPHPRSSSAASCRPSVRWIATKGGGMNVAYLSALSALCGSALGGMASIVTNWLNQHSQDRSQRHAQSIARRERLYGDFVDEASALLVDALTNDKLDPSKFVQIYATVGKLRLFASSDVVSRAGSVMRDISEMYYQPKRDYANRDAALKGDLDVLQAFTVACRDDLRN